MLIFLLSLSYYISSPFQKENLSILTLEAELAGILSHPIHNYWNEKTFPCMALGFLIWLYFVNSYLYHNRKFMFGKEHGTATWEDVRRLNKTLADKNPAKNRIVSANLEYFLEH
jgi:hypothetical protein